MIIGIDVGGSTTKIVGVKDGEIRNPMFVTAKDLSLRCLVHSGNIYTTILSSFRRWSR